MLGSHDCWAILIADRLGLKQDYHPPPTPSARGRQKIDRNLNGLPGG